MGIDDAEGGREAEGGFEYDAFVDQLLVVNFADEFFV